ncbi:MAG: cytochrome c maturation protein CcmE [Pseudomonadota bacterium]
MKTRHKRLAIIVSGVVGLTVATLLVLNAFNKNLVFFHSPTEILEGKVSIAPGQTIRIGGLVEQGSVKRSADGLKVDFVITDLNKKLPVHYEGLLPDLFREGQGVVAQGRLQDGNRFMASEVLAKHDEKYMPPEAAQALQGGSYAAGDEKNRP